MGKISPVSAKYIVHTSIHIDGTVDRPDIIGAIFGQTEGLLGAGLELRELQKSGRIGRIEVTSDIKSGKTAGSIVIPSSLDKTETAVVAAAMETIQRIGPCNATVKVKSIEDVRISKRNFVIQRAKELLKSFTDHVLPDSQEITEEVSRSVRMMEIVDFGKDRLPAGPNIEDCDELIIVEGRADVLNLLKCGFKNVVGLNGTSAPQSIIPLCQKKDVTLFVDGDRGGDLIIREVMAVAELDFVVKAPDGKEVEELTKKEIHKALRGKVSMEQAKHDLLQAPSSRNGNYRSRNTRSRDTRQQSRTPSRSSARTPVVSSEKKVRFKELLEDLVGTRGAYLLDEHMKVLGKVPSTELQSTLRSMKGVYAVIFDGNVTRDLVNLADKNRIKCLIGMDSKVRASDGKVSVMSMKSF